MRSNSQTAVLIFAESIDCQTKKKSLVQNPEDNYRLLNSLTQRSFRAAQKTGFDVIEFNEDLQKGSTFGSRLSNAIQYVFNRGYDKVIVIGSDCPDVQSKDIVQIDNQLDLDQMVFGPDYRGGVYAIGLNKESFEATQFKRLSWQTSELKKSLCEYAKCMQAPVFWLDHKADFNDKKDINEFWQYSRAIRSVLEGLYTSFIKLISTFPLLFLLPPARAIESRGP